MNFMFLNKRQRCSCTQKKKTKNKQKKKQKKKKQICGMKLVERLLLHADKTKCFLFVNPYSAMQI